MGVGGCLCSVGRRRRWGGEEGHKSVGRRRAKAKNT